MISSWSMMIKGEWKRGGGWWLRVNGRGGADGG